MTGDAPRRLPADARAGLLVDPATEPSFPARLDGLLDEVRVARLIAHMRPYLLSSPVCVTQPMPPVVPAQRQADAVLAEQRLDDIIAERRAREARSRHVREVPRARRRP